MSLFHELQQRRAKVLFVCLANSARSQMAEALALTHASDVLEAESAGIEPAQQISRRAASALAGKGIPFMSWQAPKNVSSRDLTSFDVVVNLCDYRIPGQEDLPPRTILLNMPVLDPMGQGEEGYREALEQVENIVVFLGDHFRRARDWEPSAVTEKAAPRTRKAQQQATGQPAISPAAKAASA